jgi:hypothetical protein
MAAKLVGVGSQYAIAFRDAKGHYLDGGKTYQLHLPPNTPRHNRLCWLSVMNRDHQGVCKETMAIHV